MRFASVLFTGLLVLAGVLAGAPGIAQQADSTPQGAGTFVDDDGSVHEGYIEAIAAQDITRGCNPPANDHYCPDRPVTRGQMAAFLNRALALQPSTEDHFVDDDGSIFEDDIDALAAAGITEGCNPPANDRFCPDDHVTRGQMAAFLVRAFGYTDAGAGNRFVDDDDSPFEDEIERLAAAGVTQGCTLAGDRFCPDQDVRRDQMASFLGRALGLEAIVMPLGMPSLQDRRSDPYPGEPPAAQLTDVRVAPHPFHDRVVFEFTDHVPGWSTSLEDTPLVADPSGMEILIEGQTFIQIVLNPGVAQWADGSYTGPDRVALNGQIVTEVVESGDFEAVNSWAIGLTQEARYSVTALEDPARLVIDVIAPSG